MLHLGKHIPIGRAVHSMKKYLNSSQSISVENSHEPLLSQKPSIGYIASDSKGYI